jgi:virulence-associated protein VagC
MAQIATAFWLAGAQAVRLPREFWFEGAELRIARLGPFVVLSPIPGPSVVPRDRLPARGDLDMPAPDVTFCGVLRPATPARPETEPMAEVRRLFGQAPANDNEPLGGTEAPVA